MLQARALKRGVAARALEFAGGQRVLAHAMAVLEQQQVLRRHVARMDRVERRQAVVARTDHEERIDGDVLALGVFERHGKRQDRGVELAGVETAEQRRRLLLAQIELQIRRRLAQPRQHARQKERARWSG